MVKVGLFSEISRINISAGGWSETSISSQQYIRVLNYLLLPQSFCNSHILHSVGHLYFKTVT